MKNKIIVGISVLVFHFGIISCQESPSKTELKPIPKPQISRNGELISFPNDSIILSNFKTYKLDRANLTEGITAPARVIASVIKNIHNKDYNLILFSDPDLAANFSMYLERLINIKTYNIGLNRTKDLFQHGASTEKDVIEANTLLQNEEAAIIENEAKFLLAGLEPKIFQNAREGIVWVICDVPEDQINKLKVGSNCDLTFQSYQDETFTGRIEAIGEMVDNITRMVKLRIAVDNVQHKIKAGMFANVSFNIYNGKFLSIYKNSVVTVQGKEYAFVKSSVDTFERREIVTGQQINDRIIIYKGLKEGEEVVTEGVMQLKGLSFGY